MHVSADWVMVIITGIYVVATILIFITNRNATIAAQEQVAEMKKEFEDNNRPIIEVELDLKQRQMYTLQLVNRGNKTAYNASVEFNDDFLESIKEFDGYYQLKNQVNRKCIIGVDQHHDIFLYSVHYKDDARALPISGKVSYESEGRKYANDFRIDLRNYMTFFSFQSNEDKLRQEIILLKDEVKRISEGIEGLTKTLSKMNQSEDGKDKQAG